MEKFTLWTANANRVCSTFHVTFEHLFILFYFQGARQENVILNKISKHWICVSSRCRKGKG